jgi:hypothetical protein
MLPLSYEGAAWLPANAGQSAIEAEVVPQLWCRKLRPYYAAEKQYTNCGGHNSSVGICWNWMIVLCCGGTYI